MIKVITVRVPGARSAVLRYTLYERGEERKHPIGAKTEPQACARISKRCGNDGRAALISSLLYENVGSALASCSSAPSTLALDYERRGASVSAEVRCCYEKYCGNG